MDGLASEESLAKWFIGSARGYNPKTTLPIELEITQRASAPPITLLTTFLSKSETYDIIDRSICPGTPHYYCKGLRKPFLQAK